jgi:hypothetical protein
VSVWRNRSRTNLDVEGSRRSDVSDHIAPFEDPVENALLGDASLEDDRIDPSGVLVAVDLDPRFGLLRSANRKANRVTKVKEVEGDGGTDETACASNAGEDLLVAAAGVVASVVRVGHGELGRKWAEGKKETYFRRSSKKR